MFLLEQKKHTISKLSVQTLFRLTENSDKNQCFQSKGQFSSVVEQRFCKPSVVGSNPTTGSILENHLKNRFGVPKKYSSGELETRETIIFHGCLREDTQEPFF